MVETLTLNSQKKKMLENTNQSLCAEMVEHFDLLEKKLAGT